jgi:hypothetical protein
MSIKLVLLKTGETVICDIKELAVEDSTRGYLLKDPIKVEKLSQIVLSEDKNFNGGENVSLRLSPWIPLSEDTEIPVFLDTVIAIVEPIENLKKIYLEKLNEKKRPDSEVSFTEE